MSRTRFSALELVEMLFSLIVNKRKNMLLAKHIGSIGRLPAPLHIPGAKNCNLNNRKVEGKGKIRLSRQNDDIRAYDSTSSLESRSEYELRAAENNTKCGYSASQVT